MKKYKLFLTLAIAIGLLNSQVFLAYGSTSEWTEMPKLENYKIGQRLILKVRDIFNNTTEQEILKFNFNGQTYVNINPKNPILINNTDVLTKQQILKDALAQHYELEKQLDVELNDILEEDYTIDVVNQDIAIFNSDNVLTIKDQGTIFITITHEKSNQVYVYFLKAAQGLQRLAGDNRVDTALEIAEAMFQENVRNVILTTEANYPDALAGSVLAYKFDAPILLIGSNLQDVQKVMEYITAKMDRTGTIYILGGTNVVSEYVEQQVKERGFNNIRRLGGANRFETVVKISDMLNTPEGTPVVIASGESFPDALSVSSSAAVKQYPLLLVKADGMPDVVKNKLIKINPNKVIVIGLEGAIGNKVLTEILQSTGLEERNIIRIGGIDRYDTSIKVAKYFNLNGRGAGIATGKNFPDALAGSVYAARLNAPLVLVDENLNEGTKQYLENKKPIQLSIFGGESVILPKLGEELKKILIK